MKIAIMGGRGGHYGSLQVQSVHGNFILAPAQATDNPADVGLVRLAPVAVKTVAHGVSERGVTAVRAW